MPAHASPGEYGASGRTATQANAAGGTALIGTVPKFRGPGRWRHVRSVRAVRAVVGRVPRGAVVCFVLLVLVRLSGKRTVGEFTPFDLIVVVLPGEAVSN